MLRFPLAVALSACLPAAASAQGGMQWVYTPFVATDPMQTYLTLAYGVPQTDAVQVLVTCAIGANWVYADIMLAADVEGLPDGSTVSVNLRGNGLALDYGASVIRNEEGIWGVRTAVPLDDPFWDLVTGAAPVSYGIAGHPSSTLQTDGARSPVLAFQGDCANIGTLRPPRAKR